MALELAIFPILGLIAIIVAVAVYLKTKSASKTGGALIAIIGIAVLALSLRMPGIEFKMLVALIGLAMLIAGVIFFAQKK